MSRIDEATFASTNLRWALLLEDHPQAQEEFGIAKGTDLGIPENYGGDRDHVVCTIRYPNREPHAGYKALDDKGDDEDFSKIQSQALGRALKRAGYPDKLSDLKAVVLWRQRRAEIEAIAAGHGPEKAAPVEQALDAAETDDPDAELDETSAGGEGARGSALDTPGGDSPEPPSGSGDDQAREGAADNVAVPATSSAGRADEAGDGLPVEQPERSRVRPRPGSKGATRSAAASAEATGATPHGTPGAGSPSPAPVDPPRDRSYTAEKPLSEARKALGKS